MDWKQAGVTMDLFWYNSGFAPQRIRSARTNPVAYLFPWNKSTSVILPPGTIMCLRDCSYPVSYPFLCTQEVDFCFILKKIRGTDEYTYTVDLHVAIEE